MVPKRRQIMGLEKFKFNWNRLKMSTSLIEKWKPGKLKTEKSPGINHRLRPYF